MTAAAITFDALQGESLSLVETAGQAVQAVRRVAEQSSLAVTHFRVLYRLTRLADGSLGLLHKIHSTAAIQAIEAASDEDREKLASSVRQLHGKLVSLLELVDSIKDHLGYWRPLYRTRVNRLNGLRRDWEEHASALSADRSSLLLLTVRDQANILNLTMNPPAPTAALRRALARR